MFWCLYDRVIRISCSQCSRVHTREAIGFITLATASLESRQRRTSTIPPLKSPTVGFSSRTRSHLRRGWVRPDLWWGMKGTLSMRRGPSTRGTARSSGWTKLRYSRRTNHLKILTASMELKFVFYLVHDADAKEEKRPQVVDFKDSLVAVWINTRCSSC